MLIFVLIFVGKRIRQTLKTLYISRFFRFVLIILYSHTFATQLLNKGANIKVVSALLGHSKVETTYEIYISLLADNTLDAINLLND